MATNGFSFANPTYTSDSSYNYSTAEIDADSKYRGLQTTEPIPAPRVTPPVMDLSAVLPASALAAIAEAGKLVFHSVGDTGGVMRTEPQLAVADAMCADLASTSYGSNPPAFFYHLGDVVYFFGQQTYYPEQFYEPYRNYDAPIFAIPGNHDGVMYTGESAPYSLSAFVANFCAATPGPGVPGFSRSTMIQPGVYFTLTAPFVRIIGLYSNTGESVGVLESSKIGTAQVEFLQTQLAAALAARNADTTGANPEALILAVHHPPFTGSSEHLPSAGMLKEIDQCCQTAGIWPDLVLSGHAHMYERYTRTMAADGRQIAYVVAGNGGYYDLPGLKTDASGSAPPTGTAQPDGSGNTVTLNAYNDTQFGFLTITVSATAIEVKSQVVDESNPEAAATVIDTFTVDLKAHTVTTSAA
jgi:hypothetical protein